jgi:hypothetical protein
MMIHYYPTTVSKVARSEDFDFLKPFNRDRPRERESGLRTRISVRTI